MGQPRRKTDRNTGQSERPEPLEQGVFGKAARPAPRRPRAPAGSAPCVPRDAMAAPADAQARAHRDLPKISTQFRASVRAQGHPPKPRPEHHTRPLQRREMRAQHEGPEPPAGCRAPRCAGRAARRWRPARTVPSASRIAPENQKTGRLSRLKAMPSQRPIRVTRRTCIRVTVAGGRRHHRHDGKSEKPMPTIRMTWKNEPPSATAASSSTPYQPIMTVSVSVISTCASWPPISGPPITERRADMLGQRHEAPYSPARAPPQGRAP